jgi:hypothetical protein
MRAAPADARTAPRAPRMSRAVLIERLPGYIGQALLVALVGALVWRGVANSSPTCMRSACRPAGDSCARRQIHIAQT